MLTVDASIHNICVASTSVIKHNTCETVVVLVLINQLQRFFGRHYEQEKLPLAAITSKEVKNQRTVVRSILIISIRSIHARRRSNKQFTPFILCKTDIGKLPLRIKRKLLIDTISWSKNTNLPSRRTRWSIIELNEHVIEHGVENHVSLHPEPCTAERLRYSTSYSSPVANSAGSFSIRKT